MTEPVEVGLGLRLPLMAQTVSAADQIDFVELMVDDWLHLEPARAAEHLAPVKECLPMVAHGIGLSIGSAEGVDAAYVDRVARLLDVLEIELYTEHLSFRRAGGRLAPQFLPLGFDEAHVEVVCRNLEVVRAATGRSLALENVAWLLGHAEQGMGAAGFVARVLERADCGLLLDLTNLLVNAANHGFDPDEWLAVVGTERVVYAHVAGGHVHDGLQVDSHGAEVPPPVHRLLSRLPLRRVLLERDKHFAGLSPLLDELGALRRSCRSRPEGADGLPSRGLPPRTIVEPPAPELVQPALLAALPTSAPWSSEGAAGPWLESLAPAAIAAYQRTADFKRREALGCAVHRTLRALADGADAALSRWAAETEQTAALHFLEWVDAQPTSAPLVRSAARHERALVELRQSPRRWIPQLRRVTLAHSPAGLDRLLQGRRPRRRWWARAAVYVGWLGRVLVVAP